MKHTLTLALLIVSTAVQAQTDGWTISTQDTANYTGVVVANGRIGLLPSARPLEVEHIILNNVYDKESPLGVSQILRGMNFGTIELEIDGEKINEANVSNWQQTLHLKEARFTTTFTFRDKATVSCSMYALRNVPYGRLHRRGY